MRGQARRETARPVRVDEVVGHDAHLGVGHVLELKVVGRVPERPHDNSGAQPGRLGMKSMLPLPAPITIRS